MSTEYKVRKLIHRLMIYIKFMKYKSIINLSSFNSTLKIVGLIIDLSLMNKQQTTTAQ